MAFLIVVLMLNGTTKHAYVDNVLPLADCLALTHDDALRTSAQTLAKKQLGPEGYASLACSTPPAGLGSVFGRKLLDN